MGLGLLHRQLRLEALLRIKPKPWPSAHTGPPNDAGPNDAEPNTGADDPGAHDPGTHDPGTDTHATVPAGPDAVLRKLLKLV